MTEQDIKDLEELYFVRYYRHGILHQIGPLHWNDAVGQGTDLLARDATDGFPEYVPVTEVVPNLSVALDELRRMRKETP